MEVSASQVVTQPPPPTKPPPLGEIDTASAAVDAGFEGPALWRAGTQMFAVSGLSVGFGFVLTVIVARGLGPQGKGAYDLMLATSTLLSTVLGLSIAGGVTYTVARGLSGARALLRTLATVAILQTALAVLILVLAQRSPVASALVPAAIGNRAIAPIASLVGFTLLATYIRGVLLGTSKLPAAIRSDLVARIFTVTFVAVGVFMVGTRESLEPALVLISLCAVAAFAGAVVAFLAVRTDLERVGPANLAAVLRFAIPQHGVTVGFFLNYRLDLFLVGYFLGPRDVGLYALSSSLAQLLLLFPNSAATVVLPRVASRPARGSGSLELAAMFSRVAFGTSLAAAAAFAVMANAFISVIFGEGFGESALPLLILLPGVVALAPVKVMVSYIAGSGRPHLNLISSVVSLAVTVLLDLLLIPRLGIVGAALASTASYVVLAVLTIATAKTITPVHVSELLLPAVGDAHAVVTAIARRKSDP